MTYIKDDTSEYRCHDWAVANDDNGTIIITLKDGRTATLTTDKNGRDIRTLLHTGTRNLLRVHLPGLRGHRQAVLQR
ncbi:MAG: hypothetical protein V8T46_02785 [Sutterella seckii]